MCLFFSFCFAFSALGASISGNSWMTVLAENIEHKPLNQLFLPGSHDSATYSLENTFGKGQDFSEKINLLKGVGVGFVVSSIAKDWAQAQNRTIYQQLNDGVRYLDLRVIYRDSAKDFYTVHGLYGPRFSHVLGQINQFLRENPKEILVIQIGDLGYMGPPESEAQNHLKLAQLIENSFKNNLISKSEISDASATVSEIWSLGKQVFLIYKDKKIAKTIDGFWHKRTSIDDYWANQEQPEALKEKLDKHMAKRKNHDNGTKFFVTQSQMTPSTETIAQGLIPLGKRYRSLKDMAKDTMKYFPKWLDNWSNKNPNIIILDFVNNESSKMIYMLNQQKINK